MKFATFAKIAAVAGVMLASVFGQSLSAHATEEISMGYTQVEWQAVDSQTRFAADLTVNEDGSAAGAIRIHKATDVTLKRGVINAASGAVVCERNEPVLVVEGTYFEEIDGRLVDQGPATARASRPAGGGGGDIIVFDIVGVASQHTTIRAHGRLIFNINPCR